MMSISHGDDDEDEEEEEEDMMMMMTAAAVMTVMMMTSIVAGRVHRTIAKSTTKKAHVNFCEGIMLKKYNHRTDTLLLPS